MDPEPAQPLYLRLVLALASAAMDLAAAGYCRLLSSTLAPGLFQEKLVLPTISRAWPVGVIGESRQALAGSIRALEPLY